MRSHDAKQRAALRERSNGIRSLSAIAALAAAAVFAPSGASAQSLPTVNGEPGFCFGGSSGVCLLGGHWVVSSGAFAVSGSARLVLPNHVQLRLPDAVNLRVGTTPETASLAGTAQVALDAGASGPIAGIGVSGPNVTLAIGEGRDLAIRQFAIGSTNVSARSNWYYVYASFGSDTTMTLPGVGAVPIPTPADGLSSQLLVGFDPTQPGSMVFYLGGGFTSLITSGTVVDGAVLFSWGANTRMRVGDFITTATSTTTQPIEMRPTFSAQGTLSLFSGDDDTSQQRRRKPIPITIAGGISIDVDGNRNARPFESFTDMRFGGTGVGLTIDDVGLGQSLNVGTGDFHYDPSACGELGRLVARVASVNASLLANTPLGFLDPGSAGYTFDALACGLDSVVQLRAGNVSIAADNDAGTPFPLTDVVLGFGRGGVSVKAGLDFFGSNLRLRGTFDGRSLRLRSSTALTLGGLPISNGLVEFVVSGGRASIHLTGYVTISGQRFGIDETFRSPSTSFSLPEVSVRQTIDLPRIEVAGVGGSASLTLRGTMRARFSDRAWNIGSGGGISFRVRTFGPAGSDTYSGDYDVDFAIGSGGISVRTREWRIPGTSIVIIPGETRRFADAYDPPSEELPPLVVAPARAGTLTLASNVRAPAASTGLAAPRVHAQEAIVTLGGNVERASGSTLDLIGVLPMSLRPTNTLVFAAMQTPRAAGASPVGVRVLPNGEIRLVTPSTTITGLSLEGISYTRDPEAGLPFASFGTSMRAFPGTTYEAPSSVLRGPFIRMQGMLERVGTTAVTQLVRLPAGMRQIDKTLTFELMTSAGAIQANIGDDGWLTYLSGPTNFQWVSLSGLEYSPAPWARRDFATASGIRNPSDSFLGPRVHRVGGLVWLQGRIERAGTETLLGTLPAAMRPSQTRVFHVTQTYGKTARIDVLPNGEVRLSGHDPEKTVSLSGVRFYVDSATDELALVRQSLYDFAKGIENPDMRDAWDDAEAAWLAGVSSATSIEALRTQLRALVGYMNGDSTLGSWNDARAGWLSRLDAATSPAQLARSLRDLEESMERSAMTDTWDDVDSAWRAELDGYASR